MTKSIPTNGPLPVINIDVVVENYQGHPVEFRRADGYLNLTALARTFGKRSNDFMRLPSTQRTLSAWAKRLNSLPEDLVVTINGGPNRGTWLHPSIAIAAARWVSEDFECWCDGTMTKIVSGEKVLVDRIPATPPAPETQVIPQYTLTEALRLAYEANRDLDAAHAPIDESVVHPERRTGRSPESALDVVKVTDTGAIRFLRFKKFVVDSRYRLFRQRSGMMFRKKSCSLHDRTSSVQ